ncbi:MAG: hypothetical protein HKP61_00910 [Dactylosporangium sp.]|nr:hypothetical protein [Dactylosporangium sp.]NNJ59530.1 hypothetical protein [Dactylosporangium sp.]
MGEPDDGDRIFALPCRKGVYEILQLLDRPAGDGEAAHGQIARLRAPRPSSTLRSLAAERLVAAIAPDTWDTAPSPLARFELTAPVCEVMTHLNRLEALAQERRGNVATPRVRL